MNINAMHRALAFRQNHNTMSHYLVNRLLTHEILLKPQTGQLLNNYNLTSPAIKPKAVLTVDKVDEHYSRTTSINKETNTPKTEYTHFYTELTLKDSKGNLYEKKWLGSTPLSPKNFEFRRQIIKPPAQAS